MSNSTRKHKHDEVEDLEQTNNNSELEEQMNDSLEEQEPSAETEEKKADAGPEEEDLNVRFLRLAADFQNYRRRVEKEKTDIYAYANERLIVDLLSVADNFERALSVTTSDKGIRDGMEMVLKQLMDVLIKNGLEEIQAEGAEFDPNFHHAVLMEKVDTSNSGHVTLVLQKGYLLNKKVIRHAMVKVAE